MTDALWPVALLHTFGSLAVIVLAFRAWLVERDVIAACFRFAIGAFFFRYALAIWKAAGVDIGVFEWVSTSEALFLTGLCVYATLLVADRDRWRRKPHDATNR